MRVAGSLMGGWTISKGAVLNFLSPGRGVNMNSSPETEEKPFVHLLLGLFYLNNSGSEVADFKKITLL